MKPFSDFLATAELHKGGSAYVRSMLPEVCSAKQLQQQSDSYYLSQISRRIFRAGLRHALVDAKWPAFEQAFYGFDPFDVMMMSDEDLENQMQNKAIIRHMGKIRSVRHNAQMVREISQQHGGFGQFLSAWPGDEIVDLWILLKKQGYQLGGLSAPRFLRMVGKDTFVLTDDVVAVLMAQGVIDKKPTAQRDMRAAQAAFNDLQQQCGLPLSHISRIISFTADVRV